VVDGHGYLCTTASVIDHGYTDRTAFTVSTLGGKVSAKLDLAGGEVRLITVDMGKAEVGAADETAEVAGRKVRFVRVSVGNPQCVVIDPSLTREDLLTLGPRLETHSLFPNHARRGAGRWISCPTG